jgi:hypothetical protein
MNPQQAQLVRSQIKAAHCGLMELLDEYREDHVNDDWFGYTVDAAGCLRAAFEGPIPFPPVTRVLAG